MPELSIIIPTYNSQRTISPLLDSIFRQDFKDIEVIVVDDGSTDATESMVGKSGAIFLKNDRNAGPSAARNRGAEKASSDRLVFFDSDVVLKDAVLAKFNKWLSDGKAGAVIGIYDGDPLNSGLVPLYKATQEQAWFDSIRGDKVTTFTPSVGAISKELFIRLGGFDAGYKGAEVEDYHFSHKLLKEEPIYLDKTIKVRHNFPNLRKLVRSYFRRCYLWVRLFIDDPRFDNNSTTPQQASATVLYFLGGLCAIISMGMIGFASVAITLLSIAILTDRKFILYSFRVRGFAFSLFTVIMNLFLSWVILAGAVAGFVNGISRKILFRRGR